MEYEADTGVCDGDLLRSVEDLPYAFRGVFEGSFRYFNWIQSECFPQAFGSNMNMVVAAPTGSGKTGIMELAILSLLSHNLTSSGRLEHTAGSRKTIYLAPTRALVHEKYMDWRDRFGRIGLRLLELTGDGEVDLEEQVLRSDVILCTPEKFDAITRKRRRLLMQFFADIGLILIDEVHILNDERGSSLEAIVSRVKVVSRIPEMSKLGIALSNVRFVAVSATAPNINDLGQWLECPREGIKIYDETMRPVKLHTTVLGYQSTKRSFMFEKHLTTYLPEVIARYSQGRSSLVFCTSRADTMASATHLAERIPAPVASSFFTGGAERASELEHQASQLRDKKLQLLVQKGVAFHHAAMEAHDRRIVEQLFLSRDIQVLCSTSTLAHGVNLPAYLVVIKSTRQWQSKSSGYREYDKALCHQMAGRAGRPQFESEGRCVIMTEKSSAQLYEDLFEGRDLIESHLLASLPEHLNNEICLLSVRTMQDCVMWLKSTFLAVRIAKEPAQYLGQRPRFNEDPEAVFRRVASSAVRDLAAIEMISHDPNTGQVSSLEPGQITSHFYLKMQTMKVFMQAQDRLSLEGILWLVANSHEYHQTVLRRAERKQLNAFHASQAQFKIPDPAKRNKPLKALKNAQHKIFLLLQEALSDSQKSPLDYSLRSEAEALLKSAPRLALAAARFFASRDKLASSANALRLAKHLRCRLLPDSKHECRQIQGVGKTISDRLVRANASTVDQLEALGVQEIERAAGQKYPFGSKVKAELISKFPPKMRVEVAAAPSEAERGPRLRVCISAAEERGEPNAAPEAGRVKHGAHLVVGCVNNDEAFVCQPLSITEGALPIELVIPVGQKCLSGAQGELSFVGAVVMDDCCGRDVHATCMVPRSSLLMRKAIEDDSEGKEAALEPRTKDGLQPAPAPAGPARNEPAPAAAPAADTGRGRSAFVAPRGQEVEEQSPAATKTMPPIVTGEVSGLSFSKLTSSTPRLRSPSRAEHEAPREVVAGALRFPPPSPPGEFPTGLSLDARRLAPRTAAARPLTRDLKNNLPPPAKPPPKSPTARVPPHAAGSAKRLQASTRRAGPAPPAKAVCQGHVPVGPNPFAGFLFGGDTGTGHKQARVPSPPLLRVASEDKAGLVLAHAAGMAYSPPDEQSQESSGHVWTRAGEDDLAGFGGFFSIAE